jgi:upstream activation factor subunit UAF30
MEGHAMSIERAISIRQPFVELILQGVKQEEYRSRPTNIRERVYLYASLQPFDSDEEWSKVGRNPGQLPVGLILGSVEIVDCRPDSYGDGYAYVLRDPVRFERPLKALNQPQPVFWRPEFAGAGPEAPLIGAMKTRSERQRAGDGNGPAPKPKARRVLIGKLIPSPALAEIVGREPLSRSKLVSRLWGYIEENNLQDQDDKRMVNADARLRRLFGKKQVSLFEMANLLGNHVK